MAELTDVLRQFDKDVVVVTHSYEEAYRLCRTIAVLSDGRIDVIGERDAYFPSPNRKQRRPSWAAATLRRPGKRGGGPLRAVVELRIYGGLRREG